MGLTSPLCKKCIVTQPRKRQPRFHKHSKSYEEEEEEEEEVVVVVVVEENVLVISKRLYAYKQCDMKK
jgi:hypothetical protein